MTTRKGEMIRTGTLVRTDDVTGISGTGVIAELVVFTDGTTVMRWRNTPQGQKLGVKPTTVIHDTLENVLALHGHDGRTLIHWHDQVAIPA